MGDWISRRRGIVSVQAEAETIDQGKRRAGATATIGTPRGIVGRIDQTAPAGEAYALAVSHLGTPRPKRGGADDDIVHRDVTETPGPNQTGTGRVAEDWISPWETTAMPEGTRVFAR